MIVVATSDYARESLTSHFFVVCRVWESRSTTGLKKAGRDPPLPKGVKARLGAHRPFSKADNLGELS